MNYNQEVTHGIDFNVSIQHISKCCNVGSCHPGSVTGAYDLLKSISAEAAGIAYETYNSYAACSAESEAGICLTEIWDAQ